MLSRTALHRHAVNGDYRVTARCWVRSETRLVGCVNRLCESCGEWGDAALAIMEGIL